MITEKGELTEQERQQLAAMREHTRQVNQRERDANFRGLAASMSIPPRQRTVS